MVGALADAGIIGSEAAGTISTVAGAASLATGSAATATDAVPCVESFNSKRGVAWNDCAGALAGAVSLGLGGASLFRSNLSDVAKVGFDSGSFPVGAGAVTWDAGRLLNDMENRDAVQCP